MEIAKAEGTDQVRLMHRAQGKKFLLCFSLITVITVLSDQKEAQWSTPAKGQGTICTCVTLVEKSHTGWKPDFSREWWQSPFQHEQNFQH